MATATSTAPSPNVQPLLAQRRFLGWALLWGAFVLAVMALWLRTKYADVPGFLIGGFWAMAFVSLGLSGWQLRRPGEPLEANLENHKRIVGAALVIGGLVLIVAALWLGFGWGVQALGESVGMGILALIALGSAGKLLAQPQATPFADRFLLGLIERRQGASIALMVLGGVLIILGLWLRFRREVTPENPALDMPLWLGPMLIGLLALGVGSYLRLTPELTLPRARVFVLIFGGGFGLLIALFTLWQAWNWRAVFFGGLPAWRGSQAWQLWLCAYLELAGLILMFACLGLARADIRVNPVVRRALYGYNAVLTGLLLLVFLIVLNIVIYVAFPFTFNWSEKGGLYALSPRSVDILENLKRPTKVYLVMGRQGRVFEELRQLLNNAQALTDQIEVEQINPDRDIEKHKELARKYAELRPDPLSSGRGVLLVDGEGTSTAQHKFLTEEKLEEMNPMRRSRTFVGEKVLMEELQFFMTERRKTKVYFLQGHGEMSLKPKPEFFRLEAYRSMDEIAVHRLVDRLRKENIEVKGLSFGSPPKKPDDEVVYLPEPGEGKRKEVPEDAGVLVIAGPSTAVPRETLDAIERYVEGKGRLIVLLDLVTDRGYKDTVNTGLEEFLKKYNVEVTNQYVHSFGEVGRDPRSGRLVVRFDQGPTQVYAWTSRESHSQLAKKFAGDWFVLLTARVIKPAAGPGKYQAHNLLEVSPKFSLAGAFPQPNIWAEHASALQDPSRHNVNMWNQKIVFKKVIDEDDKLPVAVSVHEGADKPRIVVVGDAEFISDRYMIRPPGEIPPEVYYGFFASMIDWLSDRPGLGIRPREPGQYVMKPEALKDAGRLIVTPGLLMTLGVFGFGVGVWVVRRR